MNTRSLSQLSDVNIDGQSVFLRLDLNVPLSDGVITSDARIRAALPTVRQVIQGGARVMLASHLGRPKGEPKPSLSLEPVAARLSELLDQDVLFAEDCIGDGVVGMLRQMTSGSIGVLENLRFHAGEEKNDSEFARKLAAPFGCYINDAFGSCHRSHASIVGMVSHAPRRAAGPLLQAEVEALGRLLRDPAKPFVAIVGGAKVSDKLGVLRALVQRVDTICIGGAMAYTFLRARGENTGASRVEESELRTATETLERARNRGVRILLPTDHVVAKEFAEDSRALHRSEGSRIGDDEMALDIGPSTRKCFAHEIAGAQTVFWNGPMGVFEWSSFAGGTVSVAKAVAESSAYSVVGGGDSVAALEAAKVADAIDHVSTGGGASLEFLEHGTLPGLDVLRQAR